MAKMDSAQLNAIIQNLKAYGPQPSPAGNVPKSMEREVIHALQIDDYFKGMFQYNELTGAVDVMRQCFDGDEKCPHPLVDAEVAMVQFILQEAEIWGVSVNQVGRAIEMVAYQNKYDPLKEWIDRLPPWDGVDRIGDARARYFPYCDGYDKDGNEIVDKVKESRINRALMVYFMQMAERWRYPGYPAEFMIIFVGKTGINKSRFGQAMVPYPEWFTSNLPENLKNKDALKLAGETPLIEMGEVEQLKSNTLNTVWNFLSIISDTFRPPYGKNNITRTRRCVFFGGSNDWEILQSTTGSRRLFPFAVDRINYEALSKDRDQILAQALHELRRCYKEGIEWRVTGSLYEELEEAKAEFRTQSHLLDDYINDFLNTEMTLAQDSTIQPRNGKCRVGDMWFSMQALTQFMMESENFTSQKNMAKEIAQRLRAMGYESSRRVIKTPNTTSTTDNPQWVWHRKDGRGHLPYGNVHPSDFCGLVIRSKNAGKGEDII